MRSLLLFKCVCAVCQYESYASASLGTCLQTKGAPAQGSGGGGSASGGAGGLPSSRPAVVGATVSASGPSADGTPPPLPKEEPSETSLSTSGFTPGRIRPGRSRLSGGESGLIADVSAQLQRGGGQGCGALGAAKMQEYGSASFP